MNIPSTLGGFQISERLGAGAMGTVYRAVQSSLGRVVVVKTLHPHLAADLDLIARFEREARHAAHLQHQNTVQVIEFGREGEVHYIAMEYVEGMDLKQILQLRGPFPVPVAVLVLRDVCRGLEAAHARALIHRDIKPANLMITTQGVVKVMDFGLAREAAESSTLTVAGSVMGSPAYMSPEQARGEPLDHLTDVFSTGLVGYEILSGARAFPGDSYPLVLHRVLNEEIPPLASLRPDLPAELLHLIEWMTRKDPAERCPSISEARDQLEAMVKQLSLRREDAILGEFVRAAILEKELQDPRPSISEAKATARTVVTEGAPEGTVVSGSVADGTVVADAPGVDGGTPGAGVDRTARAGTPGAGVDRTSGAATPGAGVDRTSGAATPGAGVGRKTPFLVLTAVGALLLVAAGWFFLRPDAPDSTGDPGSSRTTQSDLAEAPDLIDPAGDRPGSEGLASDQTRRDSESADLTGSGLESGTESRGTEGDRTTRQPSDNPSDSGGDSGPGSGTESGASPGSDADTRSTTGADTRSGTDADTRFGTDAGADSRSPARNPERGSDDTQRESARTERQAGPFEQEYSISTFPGFAFIRLDGRLINEDGNLPVRAVLREGTHTFQLTRSNGEDLGTLQYSVARGDPNRVLILKFQERIVEARVK